MDASQLKLQDLPPGWYAGLGTTTEVAQLLTATCSGLDMASVTTTARPTASSASSFEIDGAASASDVGPRDQVGIWVVSYATEADALVAAAGETGASASCWPADLPGGIVRLRVDQTSAQEIDGAKAIAGFDIKSGTGDDRQLAAGYSTIHIVDRIVVITGSLAMVGGDEDPASALERARVNHAAVLQTGIAKIQNTMKAQTPSS